MSISLLSDRAKHRLVTRLDALPLFLLAVAVLIFFWPVILGRAWIPAGGGDLVSFIYPMYRFTAASLHGGELPLWNPHLYAGAPLISDNQSGVFYPLNLLLYLLNPEFSYRAIEGLVILHIFLAGMTMYFCLRWFRPNQPLNRASGLVGGLAFMFSGVFITHIGNLNLIAVLAWLPLIFICLHRAIISGSTRGIAGWTLAGGVALGASTLAGHGQMTFLILVLLGMYALYSSVLDRRWRGLFILGVIVLIGLATAALSLVPAYENLDQTLRGEFDLSLTSAYALPWEGLIGLVAPDFFGRGIHRYWGSWSRVEFGYLGILPWLLAFVTMVTKPTARKLFFLGTAIIFLILALGSNTPVYPFLLRLLPVFPFQAPARFILLTGFAIATLAAFGLDWLSQENIDFNHQRYYFPVVLAVGVVITLILIAQQARFGTAPPIRQDQMARSTIVFAALIFSAIAIIFARIRGWISISTFAPLALLLLSIDLVGLGRFVEIEWNDPTTGFADSSVALDYLQADSGIHRVDIASGWQPSLPQLAGLYSIGGVYNPLALSNYTAYAGSVGYRGSPLYNLFGVKYVIAAKDQPPGDTNILVPVYNEDPQVDVYLNKLASQRVSLIYESEVITNHDAVFDRIHEEDFDPLELVIIEGGQALSGNRGNGEIIIARYDLNDVAFQVTTDQPAYLLLTDIYHPAWQAYVDGQPQVIEVADYAFRGVYVTEGQHTVEFRFSPPGWWVGLGISVVAWLAVLFSVVWLARQRKTV